MILGQFDLSTVQEILSGNPTLAANDLTTYSNESLDISAIESLLRPDDLDFEFQPLEYSVRESWRDAVENLTEEEWGGELPGCRRTREPEAHENQDVQPTQTRKSFGDLLGSLNKEIKFIDNRFECPISSCRDTFKRKHNVRMHVLHVHYGLRDYKCTECLWRSKRKYDMVRHLATHKLRGLSTLRNKRPSMHSQAGR